MKTVGIIGSKGIVGSALKFGFGKLGHKVLEHDLLLDTKLADLIDTEAVFICVPTPKLPNGRCDTSIVETIVDDLFNLKYKGIVVIKSTIIPGTCAKIQKRYSENFCDFPNRVAYCGEFLRERHAISDFVENNKLLAVGTNYPVVFNSIKEIYGKYPKKTIMLTPTQCEILKYMNNTFGALRVCFANEIKDLCDKLGEEYMPIKDGFISVTDLPDQYFDVNDENCRGYSSICWNKDIPALVWLLKILKLDLPLINNIETSNNLHKKTPFGNTRE